MQRTKSDTLRIIEQTGVIAIIRANTAANLIDISKALIEGGVVAIEVTMTTPDAIAGIEAMASKLGERALVGVGTVLDAATCRDAIAAGAEFVISPTLDRGVIEMTRKHEKVSIPGAFTPTEIWTAWTAGADVVKVFPATALGPQYFKDILAPLPKLKLTPTGGVDVKSAPLWIKAGAAALGLGSALVTKEAMANQDWKSITQNARAFIEAVKLGRA